MKRFVLPACFGFILTQTLAAQQPFVWTGSEIFAQTNNPPPTIDAPAFIIENGATFGAEVGQLPFTTSDTLNVTNYGVLIGFPGFDFEYFPDQQPGPVPGVPAFNNMASTFANIADGSGGGGIRCFGLAGAFSPESINTTNTELATLKVKATNIIDNGLVIVDNDGLIDFRGVNLDLRRSQFDMSGSVLGTAGNAIYSILDWGSGGQGTNSSGWLPATELAPTFADSAVFTNFTGILTEQMVLNNSTPYFQSLNPAPAGGTIVWRAVFLQDFSPQNVTHNVYFDSSSGVGNGAFHIEWVGTYPNPVTGVLSTNYFYLSDVPVARRVTNFSFSLPPDNQSQRSGEFTLSQSTIRQILGTPVQPGFTNPFPAGVTNDFGFLSVDPSALVVTNEVDGGSPTNVPGRLQLVASQSMNLANAQISGPNYLLLDSPVDFEGNSNSLIASTFADLNLGVTNGLLTISNLLIPNIPVWTGIPTAPTAVSTPMGGLQAWSGSFFFLSTNLVGTNAVAFTNDVRILLVNSALQPTGPTEQQNVNLHTGNELVISDQLNILNDFSSDAQVITITTNGPGAFNLFGQLNLFSPDIFWSTSVPNLQYLTNFGEIDTQNQTFFAGNVSSPYSDLSAATPYQAFINYGIITNQGTFIRANSFQNSGLIQESSSAGSIDIATSGDAIATNGSFIAPAGYVSISANSLLASNGVIDAGGGPLTLAMTQPLCSLSDGYVLSNQFAHATNSVLPNVVTNGNTWVVSGGIQIPAKPPVADLLGTTIFNEAFGPSGLGNFVSVNLWPGADRGTDPTQGGFADNLAVGRMILDSGPNSQFSFAPANGPNGHNALYVDSIEFQDYATNTDGNGNLLGVVIQPGMNIYYAQAIEGGVSIAEKLNGKFGAGLTNGGRFFWVSNYAGVYSSTNIPYPDNNTYIFNEALAISPDINSGGPDGSGVTNGFLPNSKNPYPIPTNILYDITVTGPQVCDPVGGAGSGGTSTNSPGTNALVLGHLLFPPESPASIGTGGGSNAPALFSAAAGSYNGLFYQTDAIAPSSSGYFSATVTSKGGFTAKLQLGSHPYSYSGVFDDSGNAVVNNVSGKGLSPLSVSLHLVNNDHLMGSVSNGSWTAQLQADRAAFSSKNGTLSAGKDTLLLPSYEENSTATTGEGFATATISTSGAVQWSGILPDGVKVTQKSALSKQGVWPVYSSLYGGSGVLIGWMQCTNFFDIGGSAIWEMPARSGRVYPGGLTNQINVVGSRLLQSSVGFSGNATAVLSGAGLEPSLTNELIVSGKSVQSSNNTLKLSVNPETGLFSGSVVDPKSNQKLLFQGALLERSGMGGGFFLDAGQSGKVYFGPAN